MTINKTPFHHVYNLFFNPGEIVELRALGVSGSCPKLWEGYARQDLGVFGYFNNADAFAAAAGGLESKNPFGVYFTPNPPLPSLIARVNNRLVAITKRVPATSDHEIQYIRWLLIDIDIAKALKPAGISSSDAELKLAADHGAAVKSRLSELGFPAGLGAMSGNGYHLMYRLPDLPNQPDISKSGGLVQTCLAALEHLLPSKSTEIDQKVFNASRIWKLYGTWARKGDDMPDRPHRKAHLFSSCPESLADVPVVSKELLETLAAMAPAAETKPSPPPARSAAKTGKTTRMEKNSLGPLNISDYLSHYGVKVHKAEEKNGSIWHILEECVFDSSHRAPDAAIVESPNHAPYLTYTCFHNSCNGKTWAQAREHISGSESLARFCQNYDPNWKPPEKQESTSAGTGMVQELVVENNNNYLKIFSRLPAPHDISQSEFFVTRGRREVFVVGYLAKYLAAYLAPICHTAGVFWRYSDGVWKEFSKYRFSELIVASLKVERIQAGWISDTIRVLEGLVNREEQDWPELDNMINVQNGMIDLAELSNPEKVLKPHSPDYGSRCQLPVQYDLTAEADRWYQFTNEIFPSGVTDGDEDTTGDEKRLLLKKYLGYCLLPTCRMEKCLFCYGTGSNGKSTVLNVLEDVIGTANMTSISIEELGHKFNIPYLQNKMVNVASEIESKEPAGTETLKKCISGDFLAGERKFGDRVNFRNRAKFIFAMNNPPNITDKSFGFKRKILVLNFNRRFEDHEMDRYLDDKLKAERNGIFLYMLSGAADLLADGGFKLGDALAEDIGDFMKVLNPVLLFFEERCELGGGDDYKVPTETIYEAYVTWGQKSGYKHLLGKTNFYSQLLMNNPSVKKSRFFDDRGKRRYCFEGIRLESF